MYPPYRVKSLLRSFTVSNLDPKSLLGPLASLGNRMKRADKKEHNLPQETKHCTKSLFSLASSGAFSCVISISGLLMNHTFYGMGICIEFLQNYENLNLTSWPIQYVLHLMGGRKKIKGDMDPVCSAGETKCFGPQNAKVRCFLLALEEQRRFWSWMGLRNT